MIARRIFGRTGHASSRVIFGAAALGRMRQERADELLPTLDEFGVNHIDVAADYGDAELLPYNFALLQHEGYRREVDALLDVCSERDVAVKTIKSIARRRWQDGDGPRFSWYEPIRDSPALERAVRFVLADDQLFLNSSSDAAMLRPILEAASTAAESGGPELSELQADVDALAIRPLFDGAALDRI